MIFFRGEFFLPPKKILKLKSKYGGEIIDIVRFREFKKSNTLFVLGNGQSINNLNEEEINIIKKNDSIGINAWAYNKKVVPDFYSFELENQHKENILKKFEENACEVLERWNDYSKTKFIIRQHDTKSEVLSNFLNQLSQNKTLFWNIYDDIPGVGPEEYKFLFEAAFKLKLFEKRWVYPSRASSLSWVIGFAYKMRYENIVLCGIDLCGDYFFEKKEPFTKRSFSEASREIHLTGRSDIKGRISIQDIIKIWINTIFKTHRINLYVSYPYSRLASFLPIYWERE